MSWTGGSFVMDELENILNKIYTGSCTKADISRYTKRIGTHICDVYGF